MRRANDNDKKVNGPMKIALDWDDTYTRDPMFWTKFIEMCLRHAVDIRIVTFRSGVNKIEPPYNIKVIYTSFEQKRDFCNGVGWCPDIWIDDRPEFIVPQNILDLQFRDG